MNDYNRSTGNNRQLDYNAGLKEIDAKHQKEAYKVAKQHGYEGADPNQPMDKDFTKQGEKFQGMIDEVKDREQLRAAFLEKIKKTPEQQDKQHEI